MMGLGFLCVLVVLGGVRELLGSGTLFADMQLLFGESARDWKLNILGDSYPGFLVAILPPGAFLVTGFLIAIKNVIDASHQKRLDALKVKPVKGSKRVRTTGVIS